MVASITFFHSFSESNVPITSAFQQSPRLFQFHPQSNHYSYPPEPSTITIRVSALHKYDRSIHCFQLHTITTIVYNPFDLIKPHQMHRINGIHKFCRRVKSAVGYHNNSSRSSGSCRHIQSKSGMIQASTLKALTNTPNDFGRYSRSNNYRFHTTYL